ncbi:bifunctional UDP-N-acetylglucosamine diphosphorylase/glucosamine-1-phosphate N-acetyltransferase GlmU [Peredibacter starrii]|uniref:Bifunctional protein GlmU n=2 Tax=Peredibacter starrii TaxID=28202 RepID=A0AAX4HRS1_9BACT|nr:bifunctional UDP-N-acetylglucosamine diphosphorylase/glucosamine-1-phosphate N-acetyltransferase GlmU [Peredibacter starrii]WPU65604.1 bifunctional UDP-N-acetylglucosamine diphosphorylase/glucosamine-1-phosphate N-acetyltransferase GlmU [Peredibacter starrii]
MSDSIGIVILAAGKGTRMKIETPKALAKTAGRPLLEYVVDAALNFASHSSLKAEIGLVVGHKKELLEEWLSTHSQKQFLKTAWQKEQNGTADALKSCFHDQPHFWDYTYTLVACADTPLLEEAEFNKLFEVLKADPKLVGVAATFEAHDPTGLGRIVHGKNGFQIVEEKDASPEQRKITEVNSGVYILKTSHVKEVLGTISNNNKSGEFYLTDLFQDKYSVKPVKFPSEVPFLGINTLEQLAEVTKLFRAKKLKKLFTEGVEFLNPDSVHIDDAVTIGVGSIIYPGVTLLGNTKIGNGVVVETGSFIRDSIVHDGAEILAHSYLEGALVHKDATIGPMARLRQGADIGPEAKIGNFVEVKKSKLDKGVKVSHLSYVGDAEIGENTNIGCGFISCNYDGANKHKTKIGKNSFIGSDVQMIAPIEIGNDAFVAAGSTISKSVPDGAFAITRAQQVTKEGAAKRFIKTKKS